MFPHVIKEEQVLLIDDRSNKDSCHANNCPKGAISFPMMAFNVSVKSTVYCLLSAALCCLLLSAVYCELLSVYVYDY